MNLQSVLSIVVLSLLVSCSGSSLEKEIDKQPENSILVKSFVGDDHEFPSYDPSYPPPDGFGAFKLSQKFPGTLPVENFPWADIDFTREPEKYMKAVLAYSIEGNEEVDFKGQDNKVRTWYHVPWFHQDKVGRGGKGREYVHGMTRERATPEFEIHDKQDIVLENWAVGMYNPTGGYTLGQVWPNASKGPNAKKATFNEGTVCCKLLFTDGTVDKVPFLKNTLVWDADIYTHDDYLSCKAGTTQYCNRNIHKVHLLQIDIAIKDSRAENDWVFGTFIYDGANNGATVFDRMIPVGLMWGDDSNEMAMMHTAGSYKNPSLKQTWLNDYLMIGDTLQPTPNDRASMRFFGLGGRLNGPVDNPISSCMSCHSQAGNDKKGNAMNMAPWSQKITTYKVDLFKNYFSSVAPGVYERSFQAYLDKPFIDYSMTDYSLQLSGGIRNYYKVTNTIRGIVKRNTEQLTDAEVAKLEKLIPDLTEVSRGED